MISRAATNAAGGGGTQAGAMGFALAAAELAYNTRCAEVVVLDLRGRSPVTEFFVIATGTSPRQMRTVVEEMKDLGKAMGHAAWQTSGLESGRWILLDCVNVVCHVFDREGREYYDLELLWGDCPRVDWRKELGLAAVTEAELAERRRFEEGPHLDQIDAQEAEDKDVTEEEVEEGEEEEREVDLPVVVEIPDEDVGSNQVELVEIDPPEKRGKRRSALYPTPIQEGAEDGEHAVRAVTMREAAEASVDEDEVKPAKRKKKKSPKKAVKKAVRKAVKKAAAGKKKSVKKTAAKKGAKKKAVAKKKKKR